MHEMSLLRGLLKKIDSIAEEEGVDQILGINIRIGALAHISADHFKEHFLHATKGGVAEHAWLKVTEMTDESDPLAQEIILESVEVSD